MSVSEIEELKHLNEEVDALPKDVIVNKAADVEEEEFIKNDMPLIISNEVLHSPNGASGISNEVTAAEAEAEKVDELSSLEREIAKMHHMEPTESVAQDHANVVEDNAKDSDIGKHEKTTVEMQDAKAAAGDITPILSELDLVTATSDNGTAINNDTNQNEFEHDDLIAVLKGTDHASSENLNAPAELDKDLQTSLTRSHSISDIAMVEGVTIEGEGQFQIMEVIDDETDELMAIKEEISLEANSAPQQSHPVAKQYGNNVTNLTQEEVRALAMEQIAGLNARVDRQRRRKQDIKPLQVESTDIVSTLGADWSDDDANHAEKPDDVSTTISTESASSSSATKAKISTVENVDLAKLSTSSNLDQAKRCSSPPKVTSVVLMPGGSAPTATSKSKLENKKQSSSTKMDESNKAVEVPLVTKEAEAAVNTSKVTGFKRTRIIKRKIIWDPDDPDTQFAYAQLVRNTSTQKSMTNVGNSSASSMATTTSVGVQKKETAHSVKKSRPLTPKERKPAATETVEKKNARAPTPAKLKPTSAIVSSLSISPNTKSTGGNEEDAKSPSPVKRRSQTPVANGAGKKKKITEIDRLMGDEGAVNMLNSLEHERHKMDEEEETPDKPHKPLMRSRAATISDRVIKRETTPTMVKKEGAAASKGKRNTKQKPSSTWDYVYKQQANEDSMIIRRRSNSSYSSTASLHRLSLDAPPPSSKSSTKPSSSAGKIPTPDKSAGKSSTKSTPKTANTTHDDDDDDDDEVSLADISQQSSSSSKQNTSNASGKIFEFAKPESKSSQKSNRRTKSPTQPTNPLTSDMKKAATATAGRRPTRSPGTVDDTKENKQSKLSTASSSKDFREEGGIATPTATPTSDVIVKKSAKVAQIIFNTHKAKIDYTFTAQMMNKLVDILDKLSNDVDCNAVLITTCSPHFCHGIDFTDLTIGSTEKRKNAAVHLATAVKNYLKTLATFPKPLIAGVNGNNIGLGVTQLPLFDIVIASDKGSYETPYAKIGQVPEGYCIWNNITKIRGTFKTKLFWLCEKLHSTESALSGLVNKLTSPNKVNEDALAAARKIAAMSAESYRVMKKTTIHNHLDAIITALDEEFDTIIEQWTSTECYDHFKKYLESRNV